MQGFNNYRSSQNHLPTIASFLKADKKVAKALVALSKGAKKAPKYSFTYHLEVPAGKTKFSPTAAFTIE